jgi:hypothetical protein
MLFAIQIPSESSSIVPSVAAQIMRRPGGKRYVVACFISMIGGGGNCNGNRDIATCMWKLNIPDDVLKWILKIADECEFSEEDHAAAHGSEERFPFPEW